MNVRADAPIDHFTSPGDGTVLDNETGLIWQRDFSPTLLTQPESVTYCAALTTPMGSWRLPSVLELASIVDETRGTFGTPAADLTYFPGTDTEYYWTAPLVAGSAVNGWAVSFYDGAVGPHLVENSYYARCVR